MERDDRHGTSGEVGDLLNGVGSTSSTSTAPSSTFSGNGMIKSKTLAEPMGLSSTLTPATLLDQSSPNGAPTPKAEESNRVSIRQSSTLVSHTTKSASSQIRTNPSSAIMLTERIPAMPGPGEAKGSKIVLDPELMAELSSKERRKMKPSYKKFGEKDVRPPPDPRLALPGYCDGNLEINMRGGTKFWKLKQREAPYLIPTYPWDPKISIGAGPPTSVVVLGFDPFTPEVQLRAVFSSYGDIASIENKTDPATGSFLGICLIRYRDARNARGPSTSAADAARAAEKEGTGQRVGEKTVKVERDRTGRRTARYVADLAQKNRLRAAKEQAHLEQSKPSRPQESQQISAEPPPNAPKGPSGRSSMRMPIHAMHHMGMHQQPFANHQVHNLAVHNVNPMMQPMAQRQPQRAPGHELLEEESILPTIGRKPYCFISNTSVPSMGTTIAHLKKRMKMLEWKDIRVDHSGYFIVFDEGRQGEDEAIRCKEMMDGKALFTYYMQVECQPYGNPNFARSPSPDAVQLQKRAAREQERIRKEEEQDYEEEKKHRAQNMDLVLASFEQLRYELREKVLSDVKQRLAAPALYDWLDPDKHAVKRRKLNLADPQKPFQSAAYAPAVIEDAFSRRQNVIGASAMYKKSFGPSSLSISRIRHQEKPKPSGNAFIDERRQRTQRRKTEHKSLHHRLHDLLGGDESDEDRPRSSREETKEQDSRPASRFGSIAPIERDGESPMGAAARKTDDMDRADDSGDDDLGIAKTHLDPHLLKKEPEDMALRELQLIIDTAPATSRLHKQAKRELNIRKRKRDDDRLFHIKAEGLDEQKLDQDAATQEEVKQTTEDLPASKDKKKPKVKRKTKKQLLLEREAAKAEAISAKAMLQEAEDLPTPEPTASEIEKGEEEEEEEEEPRAEVEWAVSRDKRRRTVEDDPSLVLDVDGWQHIVKDAEDFTFLRKALEDITSANIVDPNRWAYQQKEIKSLNSNGATGATYDEGLIKGYYVANLTGSARTEGIGKILESEKSKYLPHRLRVAAAREKRQSQAKAPAVTAAAADAAKQAKLASSALSRSTRANNRTQIKDLNTAKQNLIADGQQGDAIRFNQLKKRKKLVKFDRSAIHGWGLYAEENIPMGDMIIEYVGERVRQAVANIREMRYDKQGMGSSYLFRIDEDSIVDATKKGGIARFINHSCAPNCTAKIIKVDGTKRIVIYALKDIAKDQELTYDYKFEREMNSDDRIPCLCGSDVCKGFLN